MPNVSEVVRYQPPYTAPILIYFYYQRKTNLKTLCFRIDCEVLANTFKLSPGHRYYLEKGLASNTNLEMAYYRTLFEHMFIKCQYL